LKKKKQNHLFYKQSYLETKDSAKNKNQRFRDVSDASCVCMAQELSYSLALLLEK
jgi:hypothetical protein